MVVVGGARGLRAAGAPEEQPGPRRRHLAEERRDAARDRRAGGGAQVHGRVELGMRKGLEHVLDQRRAQARVVELVDDDGDARDAAVEVVQQQVLAGDGGGVGAAARAGRIVQQASPHGNEAMVFPAG